MEFVLAYLDRGAGHCSTFSSLNRFATYWSDGFKKYISDKPELKKLMEDLDARYKLHGDA